MQCELPFSKVGIERGGEVGCGHNKLGENTDAFLRLLVYIAVSQDVLNTWSDWYPIPGQELSSQQASTCRPMCVA